MNDDLKQLCATIGRALLAFAGEQQAEPQRRRYKLPERSIACAVCGTIFQTHGGRAKYCPACAHKIQLDKLNRLVERRKAAKTQQEPVPQDMPPLVEFLLNPPPAEKVRCERMHAWITPDVCGTRGECQGKPLCPNLPGGKGC